jgi:hypothetical protein
MCERLTELLCAYAHTYKAYAAKPTISASSVNGCISLPRVGDISGSTAVGVSRGKVELHLGISGCEQRLHSFRGHCFVPFASCDPIVGSYCWQSLPAGVPFLEHVASCPEIDFEFRWHVRHQCHRLFERVFETCSQDAVAHEHRCAIGVNIGDSHDPIGVDR